MKNFKINAGVFLLVITFLSFGGVVFGQGTTQSSGSQGIPTTQSTSNSTQQTFTLQNPLSSKFDSVGGLLQGFIEIFSYLIILFAVLALIWTGLQYVLARGNPEEMKRLSNQLLYIVIGVAVVIGARLIIEIVINTLSASGAVNSNVINSTQNALHP
jgi:hypothetical protein